MHRGAHRLGADREPVGIGRNVSAWGPVTRWDSEQGRVVEKRGRVVKSPEQRERERRAKLEHKIAKYRANGESQRQALGRP